MLSNQVIAQAAVGAALLLSKVLFDLRMWNW